MTIVKKVIIYTNGAVMSFDEKGEQIPEYQGFILDMGEKLKSGCDEDTKWSFGKWTEWRQEANFSWYWEQKKQGNEKKEENGNKCDSHYNDERDK